MDFSTFYNVVGNELRAVRGSESVPTPRLNPVPVASAADVEDCVVASRQAFPAWSQKPYHTRTGLLEKFADLYIAHAQEFCALLANESGRTAENAAIEVYWAAQWLRYPSKHTIPEEVFEDDTKITTVTHEPLGLVAAICPWNFPLAMALGKMAPSLATGNCVLLKPSEFSPYTTLKLVELAQKIFPPGVVQALNGDKDIGSLLVQHPGVAKISFTGSTETGKQILRNAAEDMKRVTLETSGNNAAIILPDIDIRDTCIQLSASLWFNAGQVCINSRRLLIHQDIFEDFVSELARVTNETAKNWLGATGPVQNRPQFDRIIKSLMAAEEDGAELMTGGRAACDESDLFAYPTIITNARHDSPLVQKETFGPLVTCHRYSDLDEAVALANAVDSGLAATVWGKDVEKAKRIASEIDVGNVFINGAPRPDPHVPFGGHKTSGLGVEYGLQGLLSFCQTKSVYLYK